MNDLYREIDNEHEYRGDSYFDAIFSPTETIWFYATPPRWKFAMYPNDQLILKDIGNDDFVIMGVGVDGRLGIPLPERHNDVEYRLFRKYLKNIQPREDAHR